MIGGITSPYQAGRDADGGLVPEVAFVGAGPDGAEVPELAEAALDGGALLAAPGPNAGGRPRPSADAAVFLLVHLDRDGRLDAATAQVGAVGPTRT
jgi:hypothetical protein